MNPGFGQVTYGAIVINSLNTVQYRYNAVNFLTNIQKDTP